MRYYRCKCGNSTSVGSIPPYPCSKCEDCGSDLAEAPQWHSEPVPHDMHPTQVATDGGLVTLTRCRWCGITQAELDAKKGQTIARGVVS